MTPRVIIFVATRLMAMWCVVSAISTLASVPAMDWGGPGDFRVTQMFAMTSLTIMPLICGVFLWVGSAWVANRVAADADMVSGEPGAAIGGESQLFATGVSLLGLVVVVQVLPELANWIAFWFAARYVPSVDDPIDTTLQLQRWVYQQAGIARGVSLLARLGVGVVLLLGPPRVWRAIRAVARRLSRPTLQSDDLEE